MYDILGKFWAFVFGVMVLFVGTVTLFAQKQDTIVQNYVDSATEEFVDISRATGQISREQYEQMIRKLDATGNVYDVEITHYKEKTAPVSGTSDYQTYYDAYDKTEILDTIYTKADQNRVYQMNTGDFLRVEVENTSTTLGRKLLGFFIGRPTTEGGQIYSSYGGYVGND